jgi:hypothetical protein
MHVDARRVNLIRIKITRFHQLFDLGDGDCADIAAMDQLRAE